ETEREMERERDREIEMEKEKERDHHKACLKHSMLCTDSPVMSKTSYCLLQNDKLSASDLCICLAGVIPDCTLETMETVFGAPVLLIANMLKATFIFVCLAISSLHPLSQSVLKVVV